MRPRNASVVKDPRNPTRPWVVRWSESTEDGMRRRKRKAFPKQREADRYASRKTRELRGEVVPIDEPTPEPVGGLGDTPLGVFVDLYQDRRKMDGIRAATINIYRDNLGRLVKWFGEGRSIGTITTDEVSSFLSEQRISLNTRKDQPLSKSSRNGIVRDLGTMFSHAKDWGYIASSPMSGIRMLRVNEDDRRGWHYFSPTGLNAIIDEALTSREKAVYAILYGTGLRFGEAFSRHPDDVDLETQYVHVRPREATDDTPPFRVKDHERRSIPIPAFAVEMVAKLKATLPKGHPYLFITPERCEHIRELWHKVSKQGGEWQNRMMVNNTVRDLKRYVARAGITLNGPVTVHALRKSYGRNGARCLSPDVLKAYMGHSDVATTLTYYSKRDADDDVRARWALDAMMIGESMPGLKLSDVQSDVRTENDQSRKAS